MREINEIKDVRVFTSTTNYDQSGKMSPTFDMYYTYSRRDGVHEAPTLEINLIVWDLYGSEGYPYGTSLEAFEMWACEHKTRVSNIIARFSREHGRKRGYDYFNIPRPSGAR